MGIQRRTEQHHVRKAVRVRSARYSRISTSNRSAARCRLTLFHWLIQWPAAGATLYAGPDQAPLWDQPAAADIAERFRGGRNAPFEPLSMLTKLYLRTGAGMIRS